MIIVKPDPNIFVIENFIDKHEADLLVNIANNATPEEWSNYNYTDRHENDEWEDRILILDQCSGFNKKTNEIIVKLFDKIKKEVNSILNKDIYVYAGLSGIYRSVVGQQMKTHHDQGLGVKFKYGIVIYLNDDYDGGEIFYPNVGVEIKPKAYSLVLHPAHEAYRHGVKEVSRGTRYSMTTFVRLK